MGEEYRTWVYHQLKSPKGKIVSNFEAEKLYKKGWVDTPAKYGKGLRGKWYGLIGYTLKLKNQFFSFAKKHWKWLITTAIALISVLLSFFR